jgi:hypothetical protein
MGKELFRGTAKGLGERTDEATEALETLDRKLAPQKISAKIAEKFVQLKNAFKKH